ncbi:hypothetical protein BC629DRAFT_340666 [Irpex lacteus]|nr:hypothetical protein BC629DRAFT_340666 [Irpex lacteus]
MLLTIKTTVDGLSSDSIGTTVERGVTPAVDLGVLAENVEVHGGVITIQTVMGILVAVGGLIAIVLAARFLYCKRWAASDDEDHELPGRDGRGGSNERGAQPHNRVQYQDSWPNAVPGDEEQLPPYPGRDRYRSSVSTLTLPGAPPPAYFPGDRAYLSHDGRAP